MCFCLRLLEKFQGKGQLPMPGLQNNYIQINNTIVKQTALQQLNAEQLKQIEEMMQRNLPAPDTENADWPDLTTFKKLSNLCPPKLPQA